MRRSDRNGNDNVIPALVAEDSWGLPDAAAIGFDGVDLLELAMPIPLSLAYDAPSLRAAARTSKDAGQTRRLLALAAIYEGATRTEAAAMGNVTLQIVRDWVLKLNALGPEGLVDYKGPGPPAREASWHEGFWCNFVRDPTRALDSTRFDTRFVTLRSLRSRRRAYFCP